MTICLLQAKSENKKCLLKLGQCISGPRIKHGFQSLMLLADVKRHHTNFRIVAYFSKAYRPLIINCRILLKDVSPIDNKLSHTSERPIAH
jgi:hypothetical protein